MRYTNNNSSYRLVCVHTFISIKVFYSTTCSRSTDPTLCSALACFASLKPQAGSQAAGIASAEGARFLCLAQKSEHLVHHFRPLI